MAQTASLLVLVACLAIPIVAVGRQPSQERRFLIYVLCLALALRLAVCLVLHFSGTWQITDRGAIAPDEAVVDKAARLLAGGDDRSPVVLGGSLHTAWLLLSWAVYQFIWNSLLAIKLINVLLGTLLVVPCYLIARELQSVKAARFAACLIAVFPNAIVWSAMALREPIIALLVTTLLLTALRPVPAVWRGRLSWVVLVSASLVLLAFTRSYMLPVLAAMLVFCKFLESVRRRNPQDVGIAVAAVALAGVTMLAIPTGLQLMQTTASLVSSPEASVYNPLSNCPKDQLCSPKNPAVDLTSSLQSVHEKGVVRAFAIAVLAGRPVGRSTEFFLLLQPGVVMWWTLFPFLVAGSVMLVRRREYSQLTATAGFVVVIVIFLAFTGQFIRHHYMLEPVGLCLAAVGLTALSEHRRARHARYPMAVIGASLLMFAAAVTSVIQSLVVR